MNVDLSARAAHATACCFCAVLCAPSSRLLAGAQAAVKALLRLVKAHKQRQREASESGSSEGDGGGDGGGLGLPELRALDAWGAMVRGPLRAVGLLDRLFGEGPAVDFDDSDADADGDGEDSGAGGEASGSAAGADGVGVADGLWHHTG